MHRSMKAGNKMRHEQIIPTLTSIVLYIARQQAGFVKTSLGNLRPDSEPGDVPGHVEATSKYTRHP